ncbi:NAD(P)-dependent oxidoreductase [Pseudonocardia sp. MH-G8]|uniref:NAD-dependent epimerase/dehydratase family protein n=1 Tax=Pseudonocardia sp. MH-G8 TaxID=1854588 RepID=UPI000BA17E99|nr:NAD(P)-dependent oxidoreductase [Pseudonocardia sp. MH-G8]OZM75672.1 hypothetical protein CFP66_45175 [Pseudonocardia sp. MH-G8]
MSRSILVTGATGRVGSRLSRTLLERGDRVRTVVLPDDPGADRLADGVEVVRGDLSDPATVAAAVDEVDAVVHLAAAMDWGPGANDHLFAANVESTYLIFERLARREVPPSRVVLASSDEVYPTLGATEEIVEDRRLAPYSFYGLTKELDERLAAFYHRAHGLPIAVARFSLVAEPHEIASPTGWSGRFLFAAGLRALLAGLGRDDAVRVLDQAVPDPADTLVLARDQDGEPYRFQFCDVRDLESGLMTLLEHPAAVGETVNLSGPSSFGYDEAVPALAERTGARVCEVRLPGPRFDVRIDIGRARALLGYAPRHGVLDIIGEL